MKNNKVLFVTEKWCDNNPDLLLTNNFHNLFSTFVKAKPEYQFHCIHFDEAYLLYGRHIDEVLVNYCKKFNISVVAFSLQGGHNQDNPKFLSDGSILNPSIECLKQLKELGVYTIIMWPDTTPRWGMGSIRQLGDIVNLHVSWDNPVSDFHNSIPKQSNHLYLWCPQDSSLYYKISNNERDIPISFLGSNRYYDRQVFINHLLAHFPTIMIRGGQREEKLSSEKYAEFIRRSKISLNFSLSPAGFYQTKGRIFEILACGSLLFEFKNSATEKLLVTGEEYIDFNSPQDLIDKIKYYTTHEDEALKIADKGHEKYLKNFTPQIFWDTIFNKVKQDLK